MTIKKKEFLNKLTQIPNQDFVTSTIQIPDSDINVPCTHKDYNFLPLLGDLEQVSHNLSNAQLIQERLKKLVDEIGLHSIMYPDPARDCAYEESGRLLQQLDLDLKNIYKLSLKNLIAISKFIPNPPSTEYKGQLKQ